MANLSLLASDGNNTEFTGAHNPDDLLHVRFHEVAVRNNWKSQEENRAIFDTIIFTEIHTPGNQLNIIDRPKTKQDEFRFPRQWAHYMNTHSDDPAKQGTALTHWPLLDVGMAEMLRAMKFFTVEQIAGASDEQISKLGMGIAGMAPMSFRDKARAFLAVARDSSAVSHKDEEIKKRDEQIAALLANQAAMQEQMQAILAAKQVTPEAPAKPKKVLSDEQKAAMKRGREAAKQRAGAPA